jgi:hypothetical protein
LKLTVPTCGKYGFVADQPAQELPLSAWSDAQNFRFRDGRAERVRGPLQVFDDPTVTPYYVTPYQQGESFYWIHAGLAKVFVDDGSLRTEITPASDFTGGIDDRWSGGVLNGVLVLNNGVEKPVYWGGDIANNLATLPGWDATWLTACIRPFKNYLIALDVTKGSVRDPYMVKWSHVAEPGAVPDDWDETSATNDAGEYTTAETPDILLDGMPMGDAFIIYKQRSMYVMRPTYDARIFQFQRLPGDLGILAKGCVADTPIGHVVLGSGDVFVHSGGAPVSIINGLDRDYLFTTLNPSNYERSFVVAHPARNEVWVCYPATGYDYCSRAMVYNWIDKTWSKRELVAATYGACGQLYSVSNNSIDSDPNPIDDDLTSINENAFPETQTRLVLTTTTELQMADGNEEGSETAYLERSDLPIGTPDRLKLLKSVVPRIAAAAGTEVQIEFGARNDVEQDVAWSDPITYTVGTSYAAYGFAQGRWLAIRFTSLDANPWSIRSYDLEFEETGYF